MYDICEKKTVRLSDLTLHSLLDLYFPYPLNSKVEKRVAEINAHPELAQLDVIGREVIACFTTYKAVKLLKLSDVLVNERNDLCQLSQPMLGLEILRRAAIGIDDPFRLAEHYGGWMRWKKNLARPRIGLEARDLQDEEIAAKLKEATGYDRRSLERYRRALGLPEPILEAFRWRDLPIRDCERLLRLGKDGLDAIAESIRGGETPRAVVRRYLANEDESPKRVETARSRLIETAQSCLPLLSAAACKQEVFDGEAMDTMRRLRDWASQMVQNNNAPENNRAAAKETNKRARQR